MTLTTTITQVATAEQIIITTPGQLRGPPGTSLTAAEVKTLYESNPDTNAFTDADVVTLGAVPGIGESLSGHLASTTPHAVLGGVDSLTFDMTAGVSVAEGQMAWNSTDKTVDLGLPNGSVLQIGQELLVRVLNNTGGTLVSGDMVYITGSQGQRLTVGKATPSVGARTLAMVTQTITNNQEGLATVTGLVRGFNTSAFSEGAELWLHPTTPGAITATRPSAPTRQILVGYCVRSQISTGIIFVNVIASGSLAAATSDVVISSPTNGQVLSYNSSSQAWINYSPQIGLLNFTESINSSTPNTSIPAASLVASGAASSIDAVFSPKGSGAIIAQVPDNAPTGGNKRGIWAVDLQMFRDSPTKVASGASSLAVGINNTASGAYSATAGAGNIASGNWSVALGSSNTSSGQYGLSIGSLNTASGSAAISLGSGNTASGEFSCVPGGQRGTTRGITGAYAWAGNAISLGKTQTQQFIMRRDTSDATPSALSTDGAAPGSATVAVMPNNSAYYCRVRVLARNASTGDSKSWNGRCLIRRGASAASTTIVGAPVLDVDFGDAALSGVIAALSADTTRGALAVTVTGIAATNISWTAHVETLEATS